MSAVTKTIFTRIIERQLPADFLFEDELCFVIKDIQPQASTHLLVIPRKPIPRLVDAGEEDLNLLGHLMLVAVEIAKELGVGDAFRLVVNNGEDAGQTVPHLHLHILAEVSESKKLVETNI
jgi:histidine triad (HIT) family protein